MSGITEPHAHSVALDFGLCRTWRERGERVLDAAGSAALANAIARQTGHMECRVLAHRYLHLAPLVGTS